LTLIIAASYEWPQSGQLLHLIARAHAAMQFDLVVGRERSLTPTTGIVLAGHCRLRLVGVKSAFSAKPGRLSSN
jgi:hypothetical protein